MLYERTVFSLLFGLTAVFQEKEVGGIPVGFLRKCTPGTQVVRSNSRLSVTSLFRIQTGDEIIPVSPLEIYFTHTGKVYQVEAKQAVMINANGVWLKKTPKRQEAKVIQQGSVATPITKMTTRSMGFFAREAGPPKPLSLPSPFGAIETADALTLRWKNKLTPRQIGKQKLQVNLWLVGADEPFTGQLIEPTSESFVVPAGALEPGRLYKWQVMLQAPLGAITIEAPLWILSKEERQLAAATRAEAAQASPKDTQIHFLLGERLWSLGLFLEALAAFQEALRRNPGNENILKTITFLEGRLQH